MKNILEKLENYLINRLNNHAENLQISEKDYDLRAFRDGPKRVFFIDYDKKEKYSVHIAANREALMDIINFFEGDYNKEKLSKLMEAIAKKLKIGGVYEIQTKGNDDFNIQTIYYAVFKKTEEGIEVEFPDLPGCVTFGSDSDKAFKNAIDALAGWLAHAEDKFIKAPSSYQKLEKLKQGYLRSIPFDEKLFNGTYRN